MKEKIEVSIIVPVFNTEKFLKECLISILKIDMDNIEIICINDGSTDNSLEILEKFQKSNKEKMKIITQENKGLSLTRNRGIDISKGKYILFLDSDDFVESKNLELFLKEGIKKRCDVYIGNSSDFYSKNIIKQDKLDLKLLKFGTQTGEFYFAERIKRKCMYMGVCRNLYKKDFLLKNNLKFVDKLIYEDTLFTPTVFLVAQRVECSNIYFYFYRRKRENSLTENITKDHIISLLFIINEILKLRKDNSQKYITTLLLNLYIKVLKKGNIKSKKIQRKIIFLPNNSFKDYIRKIYIILKSITLENYEEKYKI